MVTGAVCVRLTFSLRRPRGHYRPNGMLRDAAPSFPTVKPDLDKLVRSTLDALTMSGVIEDDARIWGLSASKQYAPLGCETGASIEIGKTEGGDE
jgi:Holliday junction resolvase RusA-like endonuclease